MACLFPQKAYRSSVVNPATGKRGVTFANKEGQSLGTRLTLRCGQCKQCRIDNARQWAMRCYHETKFHTENDFLTLTYDDAHLPEVQGPGIPDTRSLSFYDLELFMKRLRDALHRLDGRRVRFYACGEYGGRFDRPHYHVLLFGFTFPDRKFFSKGKREGETYYTSRALEKIWGKGNCLATDVSFDSACYVASYCVDKINGERAAQHYAGRVAEDSRQSLKPGIGYSYFEKFRGEVYNHDSVVINGLEVQPPRYYDKLAEQFVGPVFDMQRIDMIRRARRRKVRWLHLDEKIRRSRAKEVILLKKLASKTGVV